MWQKSIIKSISRFMKDKKTKNMVFLHFVLTLLFAWGLLAPSSGFSRFFSQIGKQRKNKKKQRNRTKRRDTALMLQMRPYLYMSWKGWHFIIIEMKGTKRCNNIQQRIVILGFGEMSQIFISGYLFKFILPRYQIQYSAIRIFCIILGSKQRAPPFQ